REPREPYGSETCRGPPPTYYQGLEEVANGELEDQGVFVGLTVEGEAPFKAQGPDRREPPETKARRLADAVHDRLGEAEARVELDRDGGRPSVAVASLEVVRVA